ncbi:MAG: 4-hydroxy-tetrahydrodipicolinate reductase [Clostridia bacterium]|nr:4-hydroxy-tetrahydrodipicolinate reductase [Clostridia bacterium]
MLRVVITGAAGRMGNQLAECIAKRKDIKIVAGVDQFASVETKFPVYPDFSLIEQEYDAIIDFSRPSLLDNMLEYALLNKAAVVIATTGYTDEQLAKIREVSKIIPIFLSYNMSLGISVLCKLCREASAILGEEFDIEIIEKHHNKKIDAPSGTAIMLANAVDRGNMPRVYGREGGDCKRTAGDIGIHAIRGGTVVGEHEVGFYGPQETVTLSHSAQSRTVFAEGAIRAALFISEKKNGFYNMNDLVEQLL